MQIDIVITNDDGQKATLSQAFEFVAAPSITAVAPTSGPDAGGTVVTVTGTGFRPGLTVQFGSRQGAVQSVSADGKTVVVITPDMR